jgi:hypothetical protein
MCAIQTSLVRQATARQSPQWPGRKAAAEKAFWQREREREREREMVVEIALCSRVRA